MDFLFGSGGTNNTTQTTTQTLPRYLEDPIKDIIKRAGVLSNRNYTPYGNQRLADFSPDTLKSFQMVRNAMGGSNRMIEAADTAATAASRFTAPTITAGRVGTTTFNPGPGVTTGTYTNQTFAPGADIRTGTYSNRTFNTGPDLTTRRFDPTSFTEADIGAYMDPYLTNVLDVQKQRSTQRFQEQQAGRNAAAVAAGAFGGDRRFVADSLAQRDLNEQLDTMEAQGLSNAFNTAADLFNTDEARRLAAFQSDEERALAAGQFNKQFRLSAYEGDEARRLGAYQSDQQRALDAARFNKDYRLEAYNADEARRLGAYQSDQQRALDAARFNQDFRFNAYNADAARRLQADTGNVDRALEASRLNAANLLAGTGLRLDAAGQLGDLAQLRQNMSLRDAEALSAIGSRYQSREQTGLDLAYQDFLRQQGYPMEQLTNYANLLRGNPTSTTTSTTTATPQPSFLSQLAGIATTGFGLWDLFGGNGGNSGGTNS